MPACKGCGKEIVFRKNIGTDKQIPLERVKSVYSEFQDGIYVGKLMNGGPYLISHFETCPQANKFSRKNSQRL